MTYGQARQAAQKEADIQRFIEGFFGGATITDEDDRFLITGPGRVGIAVFPYDPATKPLDNEPPNVIDFGCGIRKTTL